MIPGSVLLLIVALHAGDLGGERRIDDPAVDPGQMPVVVLAPTSGVTSQLETTRSNGFLLTATMGAGFDPIPMGPGNLAALLSNDLESAPLAPSPSAPGAFAFGPASPNPFERVTSLVFDLPTASRVRIETFDVRGRRVKSASEELGAGRHQRTWTGMDETGHALSPGIYLVRLSASPAGEGSEQTAVRKILKLR